MNNLQHFKYNVRTGRLSESYQYGSDSFGNVNSLINLACYTITDQNGTEMGYLNYVDNASATNATPNFYDAPQVYNETGAFHIKNVGSFASNISFIGDSTIFTPGLVVPTIISATGVYYNKIDQIVIQANEDGSRDVWISLK